MAPKDKDPITKKSDIIYRYKCDRLECDEEYIGESARAFGERYREHLKTPSPVYDHRNITGHATTLDNLSIVGREDHNLMRLIKEAIYIRVNNPSLNRNIGKYHLPHIWDEVMNNIAELKIKNNNYTVTQWLFHVDFPPATVVITSATVKHSNKSGFSICHSGNNINHNRQYTSAIYHSGFYICHIGN